MLADALPERTLPEPRPWRRAAILVGVGLLHVLFIFVLLQAAHVNIVPQIIKREPITIWLPPPKPKVELDKKKPVEREQHIDASQPVRTAPITVPPPTRAPSTDQDGIGKLGRYLKNCSAQNYDALTPQEWADCLGGAVTRDGTVITLGNVRTLWEKQHAPPTPQFPNEAHDDFAECPIGDPRRLRGIPCYQHNGQRQP